jgi:hypothetical protein
VRFYSLILVPIGAELEKTSDRIIDAPGIRKAQPAAPRHLCDDHFHDGLLGQGNFQKLVSGDHLGAQSIRRSDPARIARHVPASNRAVVGVLSIDRSSTGELADNARLRGGSSRAVLP